MITEQTRVIVLQLTDELLAQPQPFMVGLDITATPHSAWADQAVDAHGHFALYANVEQYMGSLGLPVENACSLAALCRIRKPCVERTSCAIWPERVENASRSS